jgi:serine O-acetyltransferase
MKIIDDYKNKLGKNKFSIVIAIIYFFHSSGFRAVLLYRLGYILRFYKLRVLAIFIEKIMHFTTNTWIGTNAKIGKGFVIRHVGTIVIGNKTVVGNNCEIRQGVTFGGNLGKENYGTTQPIVGNNVLVGAGAKILGPVKVGDNSIIGANSVVTRDVPSNSVVAGIPGKVIRVIRDGENPLTINSYI